MKETTTLTFSLTDRTAPRTELVAVEQLLDFGSKIRRRSTDNVDSDRLVLS